MIKQSQSMGWAGWAIFALCFPGLRPLFLLTPVVVGVQYWSPNFFHSGKAFCTLKWGAQALAKGGSGDVLAGMIGALIAQGYSPKDAAIHASLAHALVSSTFRGNNFAFTPIDICKGLKWL